MLIMRAFTLLKCKKRYPVLCGNNFNILNLWRITLMYNAKTLYDTMPDEKHLTTKLVTTEHISKKG